MRKEKKQLEPENEDNIFEFSLTKNVARRLNQLVEKLKVSRGELLKLFILRGLAAFDLAQGAINRPAPMKAAKAKAARLAAPETLAVIDLAKLPPQIADYIGIQAANQGVPLEQHVIGILEAWFGYISGDDVLSELKGKRIKK